MWRLAAVVAVPAVLVGALWLFQRHLVFFPDTSAPPLARGAQPVVLRTADGLSLNAWHFPGPGPTVLVAPGNAGNRADRVPLATALVRAGFAVLLLDYRGYGGNPGSPSEEGLALDVRAARQHLVDTGVTADRLLYYGESLGCAVVAELATEHPPAGLLLRSPFVDLATAGRTHYPYLPVGLLLRDRFPVLEHVTATSVPTTVVYGTADTVVPPAQSLAVAKAAHAAVVAVDADHNDRVLLDGSSLIDAVVGLKRQ
ncbi:alpha/beta hydrolase [Umezawaea endophytica]|uniref:Alpha/beta fold hydrolase n=1 Tax=Umezawaea endophytica TaxID=1654476 RepID=A0A9X2VX92_9PSEU|nr:alpha/beta fold hydrolase [Umezawaea endophytica]MCS7483368.1 alpha/beta fold hydrolase [Umezawaea endophytica]